MNVKPAWAHCRWCVAAFLLVLFAWASPRSAGAQSSTSQPPVLRGQVIAGRFSDAAWALRAVGVNLYCSESKDQLGEKVSSTLSATDGWFDLPVLRSCTFYNLVVSHAQDSADFLATAGAFAPVIADTVSGKVVRTDWIQYQHPLEGQDLKNNIFWLAPASELSPTATPRPPLLPRRGGMDAEYGSLRDGVPATNGETSPTPISAPTPLPAATPESSEAIPTQTVQPTNASETPRASVLQWALAVAAVAAAAATVRWGMAARRKR